jgi:hypothetical protein
MVLMQKRVRFQRKLNSSSIVDLRVRDGKRESVFRSYTFPYMEPAESDGAH